MAVIDWPENLTRSSSVSWFLHGVSGTYGPGLNGRETITFTEGRMWSGTVGMSTIWGELIPLPKDNSDFWLLVLQLQGSKS